MSVAGISSSNLFNYATQSTQNKMQQFQQEFQQLGQDLQSGNMTAAQSDFATLQQYAPQSNSTSQSNSPIAQEFSQLAKDIQSGNTTAAQQDYSTIQQDMQSHGAEGHHHHHSSGGGGEGQSAVSQLMSQLGQALQAGNLSSAQQAYSTLQQEFQQFTQNNGVTTPSSSNNVSVSV
jgi:outer membrane protein assembly factor BamD (BamD/ComL family)